jgi:hypothetical protein
MIKNSFFKFFGHHGSESFCILCTVDRPMSFLEICKTREGIVPYFAELKLLSMIIKYLVDFVGL